MLMTLGGILVELEAAAAAAAEMSLRRGDER